VQAEKHQVIQPRSRRILIVDDNVDAAEMLAVMPARVGARHARRVRRTERAQRAEEFQPEIVLLDLGLPTLDGYETGRRLRETACGRARWSSPSPAGGRSRTSRAAGPRDSTGIS
jgi:CheY-like chemotaxis protein